MRMSSTTQRYFKIDSRRLSFAEYWRMSPGLGFLIAALLKVLRIPLRIKVGVPYPEGLLRADPSELDVDGRRARLRRDFEALGAAGFSLQFLYKQPSINPDGSAVAAAFLSEDGLTYAVVIDSVTRAAGKTLRQKILSLVTPISGGGHLITSTDRKGLKSPPEYALQIRRSRKAAKVIEHHRRRLLAPEGSGATRLEPDRMEEFVLGLERRAHQYQIERGVFVEMSDAEVEKLRRSKPTGQRVARPIRWLRGWALWPVAVAVAAGLQLLPWWRGPADFWDESPAVYECTAGAGQRARLTASGEDLPTLMALFDQASFAVEAQARLAEESLVAEGRLEPAVTRLGSLLLIRSPDGQVAALEPFARALAETGATTLLDDPEQGRVVSFQLRWPTSTPLSQAATEAIGSYLVAPNDAYLTAPWVPESLASAALSDTQAAARRAYLHLQDEPLPSPWKAPFLIVKSIWQGVTMSYREEDAYANYRREELARAEARVRKLVAKEPEVDAVTAEKYLQWYASLFGETSVLSDPFREERDGSDPVLDLGLHLGQLELDTDSETGLLVPADSAYAFSAAGSPPDDEVKGYARIWYLDFVDPMAGLPSFLDYLCRSETAAVELDVRGLALDFSDGPQG